MARPVPTSFAPTGMVPTKEMTPHVPVTPAEIVEDVRAAHEIGITSVHLHARDPETGEPTWRKEVFAEIVDGIREFAPELVVCVSLSGRDWDAVEKRTDVLDLTGDRKPDMRSLTLASMNFSDEASVNSPETVETLATAMGERGVLPELEAFDLGMVNYATYLAERGVLEPPHYVNLLLGNVATAQPDLVHVGTMIRDLPADSTWGAGRHRRRATVDEQPRSRRRRRRPRGHRGRYPPRPGTRPTGPRTGRRPVRSTNLTRWAPVRTQHHPGRYAGSPGAGGS